MTAQMKVTRWGQGMDAMEIVTRAAWCSYANDERSYTVAEGEKLCRYLFEHGHWTPFAQVGWYEEECPSTYYDGFYDWILSGTNSAGFERLENGVPYGSLFFWMRLTEKFLPRNGFVFERFWNPEAYTNQPKGKHERINLAFDMPIFVARQIMKSNAGIVWNEMSRRYVKALPTFFFPKRFYWKPKKGQSKQGRGKSIWWLPVWPLRVYCWLIKWLFALLIWMGMCPEQARMILPQNTMTRVCGFASRERWQQLGELRTQPDVQAETRIIGEGILEAIG